LELAKRARAISPSPTMSIDAQAKEMKARGVQVINFSAGEPDFGTPQHINDAAIAAINEGFTRYTPVAGIPELRQAAALYLNRRGLDYQSQEIVISTGAKHSLYNIMQVLLNDGDEVVLPAPYWVSYYEQVKLAGGVPVTVDTTDSDFKLTPEALLASVTPRTKMLVLNTPSNPSGAVYTRKELEALAGVSVARDLVVVSDEIYAALLYDGAEHTSIAGLGTEIRNQTIVVDGVSKTFAMTGWRIGFAAAPAPVAKAMADLQSHSTSNATSIAQKAAAAALTGTWEPIEAMRREFENRRNLLVESLNSLPGVKCSNPSGAFYVFVDVRELFGRRLGDQVIKNSTDLASVLLNQFQVAVVPGIAFGCDNFLRLSYATAEEQIKLGLQALKQCVTALA